MKNRKKDGKRNWPESYPKTESSRLGFLAEFKKTFTMTGGQKRGKVSKNNGFSVCKKFKLSPMNELQMRQILWVFKLIVSSQQHKPIWVCQTHCKLASYVDYTECISGKRLGRQYLNYAFSQVCHWNSLHPCAYEAAVGLRWPPL